MGKKSSQNAMKISKHEKKQLNSLIKILKPKVYITDSSNFKNLVQELTGNGKHSPVELSPPPPSITSSPSPLPTWEEVLFAQNENHHHHHAYHQEMNGSCLDLSFDSSCFATPSEGSPELSLTGSLNCELENSMLDRQKMDFYKDLEAMLMEMDSCDHACNYGIFQQEQVCLYDYDLSTFI